MIFALDRHNGDRHRCDIFDITDESQSPLCHKNPRINSWCGGSLLT